MENISKDTIAEAARGDISAFREIYTKTSAFVYNVAFRITGNNEDADEVTQDVFVKMHRNIRKFRHMSSLKTWIYRIAVNTAINHRKAGDKHQNRRVDYEIAEQSVYTEETARKKMDSEAGKEKVYTLLNMLNSDQRACVVLRDIQGLNYKEIAGSLGININTVRTRLKRARHKLLNFVKKG